MNRKEFYEKAKNIIWAAIFAVALWLVMVQSEQQPAQITARLNVVAPPGVNVKYNTPNNKAPTTTVTVRGSASALARLDREVDAVYRVPDDTPMGPKSYAARDFEFRLLQPGVEVDKSTLATQEVPVELAKRKTDQLRIEFVHDGKLPDGWEIEDATVEPRTIEASGSIEEIDRGPDLKTESVNLMRLLERQGFDPNKRTVQTFEKPVMVLAPEGSGINFDPHPVTVRIRVRPKPMERDIEIAPAFQFAGPIFQGLPYKFTPLIAVQDKVKIKVSGPEQSLIDAAIEKTKASFTVLAKVPPELLGKGALEVGGSQAFEVVVIPPSGLKVLEYEPKLFRIRIDPIDSGVTTGGK